MSGTGRGGVVTTDGKGRTGPPLRVAVVGCGLIGRRRAEVVRRAGRDDVVIVVDGNEPRAEQLAREIGCLATADWQAAIGREEVDVVIVATTHDWLAPISIAALRQGKHVLVEKPMARNPTEAEMVVRAAVQGQRVLGVGFNHRYHPAIWEAHELLAQGAIGEPFSIRCRYGHGGRPGYEKEWRMVPEVAGGGELLDQGIHAVDLFRWFLGDLAEAFGFTATYVWGNRPTAVHNTLEDNGFALFRTATGQVASLHASWTQWKNLFSFEVTGRDGYLIVEGLGGSYGPERLTWGRRRPESGAPDEEHFDYPAADRSWEAEWLEFVAAIREERAPLADGHAGWQAVRAVFALYESARSGRVVRL